MNQGRLTLCTILRLTQPVQLSFVSHTCLLFARKLGDVLTYHWRSCTRRPSEYNVPPYYLADSRSEKLEKVGEREQKLKKPTPVGFEPTPGGHNRFRARCFGHRNRFQVCCLSLSDLSHGVPLVVFAVCGIYTAFSFPNLVFLPHDFKL